MHTCPRTVNKHLAKATDYDSEERERERERDLYMHSIVHISTGMHTYPPSVYQHAVSNTLRLRKAKDMNIPIHRSM